MTLIELKTDDRHLIASDTRHNKGKGVKAIVQSAKRKSNTDSETKYTSDGMETVTEPTAVE